jgi:hypothetical protein
MSLPVITTNDCTTIILTKVTNERYTYYKNLYRRLLKPTNTYLYTILIRIQFCTNSWPEDDDRNMIETCCQVVK